jgi:hypothetical protein
MRVVGVNDRGLRVGEDHQRAKLTDADIEAMLSMRSEGFGYQRLADIFECSKSHVRHIVKGLKRHQRAVAWRRVPVPAATAPLIA